MDINSRPVPLYEQANRLLRFTIDHYQSGSFVKVHLWYAEVHKQNVLQEPVEERHLALLLDYLSRSDYIQMDRNDNQFRVSVEGYHHLETLDTAPDTTQAFVAMWFDDSMEDAYEKGIVPAIEIAGYDPLRIDRKEFLGKIDDEIIAEIRRSRFVVADFSHGDKGVRGSVYYEAGFAHGLGLPVIYLCREGSDLAFDTNHYPHIMWETPDELREQLRNRILALIGEGPNVRQ